MSLSTLDHPLIPTLDAKRILAESLYRVHGTCDSLLWTYEENAVLGAPEGCFGEAERAYRSVVAHLTRQQQLPGLRGFAAEQAARLMHQLSGTWAGKGCLSQSGWPGCSTDPEGFDECTWIPLEEMAAATGLILPPA